MASAELEAALAAARAAGEVIAALYRRNLAVKFKADRSPVTEADLRAEEAIRSVLCARFPGYGFYGEETGRERMQAESIWLVDPIDGTKGFVRDCPFFSTQIALLRAGRLVLGVSSATAYGELCWAEVGAGAYLDGRRLAVSTVDALDTAILSVGNLKTMAADPRRWERLGALIGRVSRLRGYGDFLHYHLLARGSLDVVLESDVCILDIAALTVIVREAGGVVSELSGGDINLDSTSILAANALLHAPALTALRAD